MGSDGMCENKHATYYSIHLENSQTYILHPTDSVIRYIGVCKRESIVSLG